MSELETNRRKFLKIGMGTTGALLLATRTSKAFAAACGLTPPQTSGPFYPGEQLFQSDNDLTKIAGKNTSALGQVIYIRGKVLDAACSPVSGAAVEIWQACATGRYNNATDTNPAALDPAFKYWGETFTDAAGNYQFKTIEPGAYPADTNWVRPPHVHFKISRLGYKELVTQLYFKGNPLNDQDLILKDVPAGQRDSVIIEFQSSSDVEQNALVGNFDITLQKVRS